MKVGVRDGGGGGAGGGFKGQLGPRLPGCERFFLFKALPKGLKEEGTAGAAVPHQRPHRMGALGGYLPKGGRGVAAPGFCRGWGVGLCLFFICFFFWVGGGRRFFPPARRRYPRPRGRARLKVWFFSPPPARAFRPRLPPSRHLMDRPRCGATRSGGVQPFGYGRLGVPGSRRRGWPGRARRWR